MKKSGLVLALFVALAAVIGFAETSHAVVPHGASPVLARTIEYNRILTTPPSVSPEQRHLLAVILAAAETQTTDPSEILEAYRQAGVLVTYLVSSDTGYVWSGTQWDNDTRSTYSYTSGKLTDLTTQEWNFDSSKWINASKLTTTYDGDRPTVTTSQTWTTDHWEDQSRNTFTYDGSGNMIVSVLEIAQGGVLVNFYKTTLTYSGGRVDSSYTYIWSTSPDPDDWVVQARTAYAYNGNGVLTMLTNEGWNDPTWVYSVRTIYTLDGSDRTIQTLTQSYAGVWNNLYKTDYTLDGAGNEILSVQSSWLFEAWSEQSSDTSRYSSNKLIEQVHYNIQFTQLTRDLYTYDGLGNQITDEYQQWIVSEWINVTRTVYVYIIAGIFDDDAVAQVPSEFALAQNYPNPFNLSTVIPYSLDGDSRVKITVSNILGQTVTTLVDAVQSAGSHTSLWNGQDTNGRDVASGVYFFRVQVGEYSEVRKMVLLK